MTGPSDRTSRSWIRWGWYPTAWTPYSLLYFLIFVRQHGEAPGAIGYAIWSTAVNVLPAAAIGVVVTRATYALAVRRRRFSNAWMIAGHLVASLVYSATLYLAICAVFAVPALLARGSWTMQWITGPGLLWQSLTGVMLYVTLAGLAHALGVTHRLRESERRMDAAEALRTRAELHALRAQLHPHFLFNTLHSVMALIRRDPPRAEVAVEQLAALLRYSLRRSDANGDRALDSTIGDELAFVRDYVDLETLRYRNRLDVRIAVDPALLQARLPSFTLQPLVENAVKHGINARRDGGHITISGTFDGECAVLRVRNDGVRDDLDTRVDAATEPIEPDAGLGLHLVRERLRVGFGLSATVTVDRPSATAFEVSVRVPVIGTDRASQPAA